jgi:hypothetical protein
MTFALDPNEFPEPFTTPLSICGYGPHIIGWQDESLFQTSFWQFIVLLPFSTNPLSQVTSA